MITIIAFLIVLGILIFVHEFGHFSVAKLCGVRVLKFSLGFGPTLVGKKIGETEYVISALPLGGYVKMFGENPDEQEVPDEEKAVAYVHKTALQRFMIVFAGPLSNLLFPVILFFLLFLIAGVPSSVNTAKVGAVAENSPAALAGVMPQDVVVAINGTPVLEWHDLQDAVSGSKGNELQVTVQRDDGLHELQVTPQMDDARNIFGEVVERRYMVGIAKADEIIYKRRGPVSTFKEACLQTWFFVSVTVRGFVKLVERVVPASEIGGPILIAQMAGEQMRAGWIRFAFFMGLLSVNLGILNLLPVPVLDGGHLVFITIEAIRRKPLTERAQIIAQQIGLALLCSLMVFAFYNDITRWFK